MISMLDKTYRPAEVEAARFALWQAANAFAPRSDRQADAGEPYCIMMPPPNVTGSLHIGHALNHTIQDTLARFHRMRGRDVLWQPGTDHAGIATQMVVERELAKAGLDRRTMGRAAFLDRVWAFKEQSGGTIVKQLHALGTSPDWQRERFTMDDGLSAAVRKCFVALYQRGLIYKDKRLVNWDTKLLTAVSDLEVQQKEINGHLWHFKYPVVGEPGQFITIATTRPETMLGDTAVAVHPEDERFAHLHGKMVTLPLTGREIPIIADTYSDPEKGTGAVKITPAHDFNDFEVGRRHDLAAISILDEHGIINDNAPAEFRGLDRFEARKRIIAAMDAQGLLAATEAHKHMVPHGDRSGTILEPFLTDQWYADAKTLAEPAIDAVESGKTRFVPKQWENTYFEWMRNIQPWCISRQLWWGHQIPAWYGPCGQIFVAETEAEAQTDANEFYGTETELTRDPDVLDTWFSSGLWAFSTLGWPEQTHELKRFYPTTVLVTGFDIIFFWVARMMMQSLAFMGDVPFKDVYIHGLVRDERGQKMSKTKGNVIDPMELIEAYGADALRLAILASTAQGRDIKFGPSRVEGYRNFVTKLWNAARFAEMNQAALATDFNPAQLSQPINRWIVGETVKAHGRITDALNNYRFNDAALGLYHFVWSDLCDWYLELIKPLLNGDDAASKAETRATLAWALQHAIAMLHPLAPFVSEELHDKLLGQPGGMLMTSAWPELDTSLIDSDAEAELGWLTRLIGAIRTARSEIQVPAGAKLAMIVQGADETTKTRMTTHEDALFRLARLESASFDDQAAVKGALQIVLDEATFILPLEGVIDLDKERARLDKEIGKAQGEIKKIEGKLGNEKFLARAPEEVVEEQRERLADNQALIERLEAAKARIS